ncbi:MAG: hypothetical protein COS95_07430 [Ignavibacteriales bacterium CG07_land_8_20_14_0_80_59_12]|nr:MAG: hypothetical protein COS95_07430 [Ignavibacteriales bacterium CG07_land_8_20_14_0_80_59_12]
MSDTEAFPWYLYLSARRSVTTAETVTLARRVSFDGVKIPDILSGYSMCASRPTNEKTTSAESGDTVRRMPLSSIAFRTVAWRSQGRCPPSTFTATNTPGSTLAESRIADSVLENADSSRWRFVAAGSSSWDRPSVTL